MSRSAVGHYLAASRSWTAAWSPRSGQVARPPWCSPPARPQGRLCAPVAGLPRRRGGHAGPAAHFGTTENRLSRRYRTSAEEQLWLLAAAAFGDAEAAELAADGPARTAVATCSASRS